MKTILTQIERRMFVNKERSGSIMESAPPTEDFNFHSERDHFDPLLEVQRYKYSGGKGRGGISHYSLRIEFSFRMMMTKACKVFF